MQAIQFWFIGYAIVWLALAAAVHMSGRRLEREIEASEASGAASRAGKGDYFYAYLNSRLSLGVPAAIAVAMVSTFLLGFGVVYLLIPNLLVICVAALEGYVLYLNLDAIEALLFERHLSKSPPERVGRWELGFGREALGSARRGRTSFVAVGVAMALLVPFAPQAVLALEWAVSLYIGGVYLVADAVSLPPGFSAVIVVVVFCLSAIGGLLLLRRLNATLLRLWGRAEVSGRTEEGPVS